MNYITSAFYYIIGDTFFWPSMALTVMIGIFLGAVIYDGQLKDIKKAFLALFAYAVLIMSVNLTRIIPFAENTPLEHPYAGTETVAIVTIFYALGMFIGVRLVNHAHKK